MKFFSKYKIPSVLLVMFFLATSCEKEESINVDYRENTILKIALKDPNLSIFVDALLATNLSEVLVKKEPYTVFAPTNKAFEDFLVYSNYETLKKVPVNLLKQLLLNHIMIGNVQSTSFNTGYVKTLATSSISKNNTMSMYVDVASGVKLNGLAKVTSPDIIASNGTIHIVDAIIDFPFITTHLKINPNLKSMYDAILNNADLDLFNRLAFPKFYEKDKQQFFVAINPLTVFSPTNTAFTDLNFELASSGGIAAVSVSNLNKILKYHSVSGNLFAANLTDNQIIPSLILLPQPIPVPIPDPGPKYEEFTIQLTGGAKIKDVKGRISTIKETDIQCWNGVIHVIDKVLLPNL